MTDRRKTINEKNTRTTLDNTADDIQETRDDNGGDDTRVLQEMVVLSNRGLVKEARRTSSLCLFFWHMNSSNQHTEASGKWVTNLGEERKRFYLIATLSTY